MTNKMERFTPQARQVLTLTHGQAAALEQKQIMPCHVLLGMLQASGCVAHQALMQAGLGYSQTLAMVQESISAQEAGSDQQVELSAETKQLLEGAVDQTRRLGHHHVGTEHLLLALMNQPDRVTSQVLETAGISRETIRQYVRQILAETSPEAFETQSVLLPSPAASPERMKVLQMIEDDKITVDEGIRLLEAMKLTTIAPPQLSRIVRFWSHRLH